MKESAGATMLKRVEREQAMKGVVPLGSFLTKVPAQRPDDEVEAASRVVADPKNLETEAPSTAPEHAGRSGGSTATATASAGATSPRDEPSGTLGGGEEVQAALASQTMSPDMPARRRRLVAASDEEDAGDAQAVDHAVPDDGGQDGGETPEVSGNYIQGVSVVGDDVDADSEVDKATSVSGQSSEEDEEEQDGEGVSADKRKKVRLEDFDDEEEFLVAGGDIEEAKTRKEWGLALMAESKEDDDFTGIESKEDRSKKALEEKRRMYRESEKRLRDRNALIKCAPVVKRSFKDLRAKIEARMSKVVEDVPVPNASVTCSEEMSSSLPADPTHLEVMAAPSQSVNVDEDDEDDDEIVIRGNTVPCTPMQLSRTAVRSTEAKGSDRWAAVVDHDKAGQEGEQVTLDKTPEKKRAKDNLAPSKPQLLILSPPEARKKRSDMRTQLQKQARSRSEHLMTAARQGIKVEREAPPGFSPEMNLEALQDPFPNLTISFIISAKYVGHKAGYVFKMDQRGLGYYKEQKEDEDEEDGEQEDVFDGVQKKNKLKLSSKDVEGLEDSDEEMPGPADDAVTPGNPMLIQGTQADSVTPVSIVAAVHGSDCVTDDGKNTMSVAEGEAETVEKARERGSIFQNLVGIEEERESMEKQALANPTPGSVVMAAAAVPQVSAPAAPTKPDVKRKYGQNGIAAMLRKQQEQATLLPEKVEGPPKRSTVWREPVLVDSDEEDYEGSDEQDEHDEEVEAEEDEEESDEEDEESDEESDDSDEEGEEKPAKKKSLNDVQSIKKNTLRLGTLDAGYLRNADNEMGYHDDVGIAKEDLEDGIDLMDTDNEDAEEEEEDSEEERRVAEGFIEDAKFAEELGLNPEEMQQFFQRQREELEEKENERILDVIRGDARRRKAAGQEDSWVPNAGARRRGHAALGQVPAGFSTQGMQEFADDMEDGFEGDAAAMAERAAERMARLKYFQEQKLAEVRERQRELQEQEQADMEGSAPVGGAAPIRRFNSRAAPALAAFSRQLSGVHAGSATTPKAAPATIVVGDGSGAGVEEPADATVVTAGAAKRWGTLKSAMTLGRAGRGKSLLGGGASLRGTGGLTEAEEASGKDKDGKVAVGGNFFFQKIRGDKDDDKKEPENNSNALPLPPGASMGIVAKKTSSTGSGFMKRKSLANAAPMKRQKSVLLSGFDEPDLK